jgi:3alpha(or 20beta)-hydroxysteroid dehydrogenase
VGRLQGMTALVTGGASGIGEGIAHTLAAHGCSVVIGDIDHERGRGVAEEIGPSARYVELDVTVEEQWRDAVDRTLAGTGRLDVLVNNAGASSGVHRLEHETPEDFQRILQLNLAGVWFGIRAVAPAMRTRGRGSIVNIASIDSFIGVAGMTTYVTTKFGVLGMTRSAALELGDAGIRVNAVHPGIIETPGVAALSPQVREELDEAVSRQPLRRMGQPEDVGRAVLFFAADDSAYCTGSSLVVDGGHLAGRHRELPG